MTPGLRPAGAAELALRFMTRRGRGDWAVLAVDRPDDVETAADELAAEMESLGDVEVARVHGPSDTLDLAARLQAAQGPVVLSGVDGWPASEWARVDHLRSRLAREERTALVLSQATFERVNQHANFSSWLGAGAWSYRRRAAELTEEERARRLEALRAWSGLTDEEVVARAEAGALPGDPEYAEWLVLLSRGDLLAR